MQIYSMIFALIRQINKQKVCIKQLISIAHVLKFCKLSSSRGGGGFNPTPPCIRPCLRPTPTDNLSVLAGICIALNY